jgi:hypothetical protein
LIPASQIAYNHDQELGSGAQGIVYRAQWKSRDVVFKKLLVRQDTSEKRAFLDELEVWRCAEILFYLKNNSKLI